MVLLGLCILVILQARNDSRQVICSRTGCTWHEDGVKLAVSVQGTANCIEGQMWLTLMWWACQIGTLGCTTVVSLSASNWSATLWAASSSAVVRNGNLILLVAFNLTIDQPDVVYATRIRLHFVQKSYMQTYCKPIYAIIQYIIIYLYICICQAMYLAVCNGCYMSVSSHAVCLDQFAGPDGMVRPSLASQVNQLQAAIPTVTLIIHLQGILRLFCSHQT